MGPLSSLSCLSVHNISVVAKWLDGSRFKMPLDTEVGLGPGHIELDPETQPPPKERDKQPLTFRAMSIVAKRSPNSATVELLLLDLWTRDVTELSKNRIRRMRFLDFQIRRMQMRMRISYFHELSSFCYF